MQFASLNELVEDIYDSYLPLNNLNQQFMKSDNETSFKKNVLEKITPLSQSEQNRVVNEIFHWGPISELLNDQSIFDILIQGPDNIYYENNQGLLQLNDGFLSQRSFNNFVERLCKHANILINHKDPFGNGKIDHHRIHIIAPPIANQVTITLRQHQRQLLTMDELHSTHFITSEQEQFIYELINSNKNFLIVGPTGSGKTTFLNSLLNVTPKDQRLVIVEDTDEIQSANSLTCKLLSRDICPETLKPVTMEDLVKQALRMRPDRIIVGEVRGQEAKDLLQALATGHKGSAGTIHADSAQQALLRLEMLIQMGAPQWSLHSIRQLIKMGLDYLIVLQANRQQKGLKEIYKIGSIESFGILLEEVHVQRDNHL